MKILQFLLFLLASNQIVAQNSKLTVYNPAPRVGDEIQISITLYKANVQSKEQIPSTDSTRVENTFLGSGNIELRNVANEPGDKTIGPFAFNFDGSTVTTDSIILTVYPELPKGVKEGIWIRLVEFDKKKYLIIEQRISNEWKRVHNSKSSSLNHSSDDVTYAKLDEEKFESQGLKIVSTSSSSRSQVIDKSDVFGSGTVSYRIATFTFEKTETFIGKFKLNKTMFTDFPEKGELDEIWIE